MKVGDRVRMNGVPAGDLILAGAQSRGRWRLTDLDGETAGEAFEDDFDLIQEDPMPKHPYLTPEKIEDILRAFGDAFYRNHTDMHGAALDVLRAVLEREASPHRTEKYLITLKVPAGLAPGFGQEIAEILTGRTGSGDLHLDCFAEGIGVTVEEIAS